MLHSALLRLFNGVDGSNNLSMQMYLLRRFLGAERMQQPQYMIYPLFPRPDVSVNKQRCTRNIGEA